MLCDDAHIASLNAAHRGKPAPTDVLSFEMGDEMDFKVSTGLGNSYARHSYILGRDLSSK